MFGDVNISAILDSLTDRYDKRIRPNYGGLLFHYINLPLNFVKKLLQHTLFYNNYSGSPYTFTNFLLLSKYLNNFKNIYVKFSRDHFEINP